MDRDRPKAATVGVLHGRVVALDDDCRGLDARLVVDLGGRTLLPGFVDAHNHLAWAGQAAGALDLSNATTVESALQSIADAAARVPAGGWVDVVGYDQRPFGRHLNRHDLDTVSAGRRVYAIHTSGHAHLVNSAVLADVPANLGATDDPGIVRSEDGEPTGLFLEEATRIVNAVRTPYSVGELTDAIVTAGRICAGQGITFVAEAGVGGGLTSRSPVEVLAYQDAVASGRFGLRAQLMISLDALRPTSAHPDDNLTHAFAFGVHSGFGSDRLSFGATKAWLDGGMMARTAALTAPYAAGGEHAGSGTLATEIADIGERARAAHAAGWQLALHAIGDRAIDAAMEIIESAQAARPRPDARHRIEHCGLVRPDQLSRLNRAGIVAVTQPTFLYAFGDDYARIMGPSREDWLYRGQSYSDAGVALAGSSDRPVADGAPLRAIQFLVQRRTRTGRVVGEREAMSVTDAVRAYTVGAAYACRVEDRVGSVTEGKYADLVVLDEDPWLVRPEELADIPIVATAVGGQLVQGSWPQ
jgi:predicted amidohydrolase YtcJ